MTPGAIEAALLEENQTRCQPPLPDSEVRQIAGSIGRYPAGSPASTKGSSSPASAGRAKPVRLSNVEPEEVSLVRSANGGSVSEPELDRISSNEAELRAEIAGLGDLEFDQQRKAIAERYSVRVGLLDQIRKEAQERVKNQ